VVREREDPRNIKLKPVRKSNSIVTLLKRQEKALNKDHET